MAKRSVLGVNGKFERSSSFKIGSDFSDQKSLEEPNLKGEFFRFRRLVSQLGVSVMRRIMKTEQQKRSLLHESSCGFWARGESSGCGFGKIKREKRFVSYFHRART